MSRQLLLWTYCRRIVKISTSTAVKSGTKLMQPVMAGRQITTKAETSLQICKAGLFRYMADLPASDIYPHPVNRQ